MDENGTDRKSGLIQVTIASSEYELVAGGSVDIEILLTNPGPSDYFIANILGIPPGWIQFSAPSTVWIASEGQERLIFTICPPGQADGILGAHPGRLYVFGQSAPDQGRTVPFTLNVFAPEKIRKTITLHTTSQYADSSPRGEIDDSIDGR